MLRISVFKSQYKRAGWKFMDFKATSWFERNYKYILTVIVIFVSIGAVFYYFSLQDKSDTFIAASVYALFLFAAGVYMSYMSNEIADKLQDRIEIYLNLQRVYSFFKVNLEKNALDYEATKRAIISFQIFTSRAENMKEEEIVPYIKQRGIKFDAKELEIENAFLELYSSLSKALSDIIENYIKDNNIEITCRYVTIYDIFNFNPDSWCREHLSKYEADGQQMVNYIYERINDLKDEYLRLEMLNIKVYKLYSRYFNRAKQNIKQIEKMYGRKLQYEISQQREIQGNFDYLFQLLKKMENSIALQINEHDEKNENYVECLEKISESIDSLYSSVDDIKDIVLKLDY